MKTIMVISGDPWLIRQARMACGDGNKTANCGSNDTISVTLRCQMRQTSLPLSKRMKSGSLFEGEERGRYCSSVLAVSMRLYFGVDRLC
jgi:hypothetical protein